MVEQILNDAQKREIAQVILEDLHEWFEIPEARKQYADDSAGKLFFAAFRGQDPIGFLYLNETGRDTVELAVMGVRKEYHRQGVGRQLFEAAKKAAAERGYSFMQVKTVRMGVYEDYDRTNCFYISLGFKEFEVLPELWGEKNPCQIYVMSL